jgi:hypothetical protein
MVQNGLQLGSIDASFVDDSVVIFFLTLYSAPCRSQPPGAAGWARRAANRHLRPPETSKNCLQRPAKQGTVKLSQRLSRIENNKQSYFDMPL